MFQTLKVETDARGVATLTLNRPAKHNAMSGEMIAELDRAARQLEEDDDVRVVVLTGAGASFSAGGDLEWMKAQMQADDETRGREARALAMMLYRLNTLCKPLIGRIQGQAFGGGIGLMSVCDVAIGVDGARFGLTETRLGLIPATIGPYVVARMGPARARRVFMSSRLFDAKEAVRLGLLARCVEAADLDQAIEEEIKPYFATAPGAVASAKALVHRLGPATDTAAIDATIGALVERWQSDEAKKGIQAFFDRTPPPWQK
ncbi:crotonase/enoyl-CoA hydratase family protein [Roseovarius sp.]|uniref:crotonase/enoyl-CoA hydratase family protein n=1 Tax=Roseovarius sp. TaxID=1486281 RepID=UPI00262D1620|nr:crotonase/enoyl-CoA hydratase family protein [Roseovarius sp.]